MTLASSSARVGVLGILLMDACAVRARAPGDVDLARGGVSRNEASATLEVDLDADWLVIECESLSRRIVVKPAGGRLVLHGLPAGHCVASVADWFPCGGQLKLGETALLTREVQYAKYFAFYGPLISYYPAGGAGCAFVTPAEQEPDPWAGTSHGASYSTPPITHWNVEIMRRRFLSDHMR
jgi:hypothetical protein